VKCNQLQVDIPAIDNWNSVFVRPLEQFGVWDAAFETLAGLGLPPTKNMRSTPR
jgi:hypothetical protein